MASQNIPKYSYVHLHIYIDYWKTWLPFGRCFALKLAMALVAAPGVLVEVIVLNTLTSANTEPVQFAQKDDTQVISSNYCLIDYVE